MYLESVSRTHTGLIREMNQDALLAMGRHGVYMVADGMGGEQAGEEASAKVVETVRDEVKAFFCRPPAAPDQVENLLREAFKKANQNVYAISVHEPSKRGLGSTASLLCLHRGLSWIGQVGDSRVYRLRDGELSLLTRDHTVVWGMYEQGKLTREEMDVHPDRHLLTRCIGTPAFMEMDLYTEPAQRGDLFLLCSDGLTGYVPEQAIAAVMTSQRMTLDQQADALIKAALQGGGGDNVSVILVRVKQVDPQDNWVFTPSVSFEHQSLAMAETVVDERLHGRHSASGRRGLTGRNPWHIAGAILAVLLLAGIFWRLFSINGEQQAFLVFTLPASPVPSQIQIAPKGGVPIIISDLRALAGKSLSQVIEPNIEHTITVRAPGHADFVTRCKVRPGKKQTVPITFDP